jgi:hypothetical protein
MAAAVSSSSSDLRAVITTLAPRRAYASAMERPMPRLPPVISATLSVSWKRSLDAVLVDVSWLKVILRFWLGCNCVCW